MNFELEVRARVMYRDDRPHVRDVYLRTREGGALAPFLMHVQCPVSRVAEIIEWAESLGYPLVYIPDGNMVPGWTFPEEKPAAPPAPKPIARPSF